MADLTTETEVRAAQQKTNKQAALKKKSQKRGKRHGKAK